MDYSGNTILLTVLIVLVIVAIIMIVKKAIQLGLVIIGIVVMGSIGFIWLPKQVERVTSGSATPDEVITQTVNDYDNSGIPEAIQEGSNRAKSVFQIIANNATEWAEKQ